MAASVCQTHSLVQTYFDLGLEFFSPPVHVWDLIITGVYCPSPIAFEKGAASHLFNIGAVLMLKEQPQFCWVGRSGVKDLHQGKV